MSTEDFDERTADARFRAQTDLAKQRADELIALLRSAGAFDGSGDQETVLRAARVLLQLSGALGHGGGCLLGKLGVPKSDIVALAIIDSEIGSHAFRDASIEPESNKWRN